MCVMSCSEISRALDFLIFALRSAACAFFKCFAGFVYVGMCVLWIETWTRLVFNLAHLVHSLTSSRDKAYLIFEIRVEALLLLFLRYLLFIQALSVLTREIRLHPKNFLTFCNCFFNCESMECEIPFHFYTDIYIIRPPYFNDSSYCLWSWFLIYTQVKLTEKGDVFDRVV